MAKLNSICPKSPFFRRRQRRQFRIGAGLLIATCMSAEQRSAVGRTLLLIGGRCAGAALAWELFGRPRPISLSFGPEHNGREHRAGGAGPHRAA